MRPPFFNLFFFVNRSYKVVCADYGEIVARDNLAKHFRLFHRSAPECLKLGARPLAPKYLNWRDVQARPWKKDKRIRRYEDPPSHTSSLLALEDQVEDACIGLHSFMSAKDFFEEQ